MTTCIFGHDHANLWERIYCEVDEDYCFICSRATDHRGEHAPEDYAARQDRS